MSHDSLIDNIDEILKIMRKFTADFETTMDVDNCHVWAYAICK